MITHGHMIIVPRTSDLTAEIKVQRALPSSRRRMVGPFIFFDQIGPTILSTGSGLDVLPHPHIGLATVTYLFAGELVHRDSLGSVQPIRPGALNWMTAGRGIVHSERTPAARDGERPLFGIQSWVALPQRHEETAAAFAHHDAAELPVLDGEGKRVRLIAGALYGQISPARTFSDLFYADAELDAGAVLSLPDDHDERAVYLVEGAVYQAPGNDHFETGQLVVFDAGVSVALRAGDRGARLMLLGGEPMDGHRHIWWNFVSSSRERIEQAKVDWRDGRFDAVPGETEFIPLPQRRPPPVQYP
jgi:redox-sensitive bicupin YhaK (pirin superfamily)